MKLVIIKGHLKDAVYAAAGATAENQNLPILKNILIEASENKIAVSATNLEIAICHAVPGKVIEPGKVTVPAATLLQIVSNLSSERINLEEKNSVLEIKTDNYEATLQGVSAEEFPIIPTIKNERGRVAMKGILLKEALAQVITSAAQASELRPELGSILFYFTLDALKFAATDSFRLAEKTIAKSQFQATYKESCKVLVPLKTTQELLKIVKDDEEVTWRDDGSQIIFETPSFTMLSRLIDGRFPDYEAIVPAKFETRAVLDVKELIAAIKLAAVFGARVSEIKLKILENKKSIQVYSAEQGLGENASLVSTRVEEGGPREMSFNWRYVLDGLRALAGDEVAIGINDEARPAMLKSPNEASYFYIVMPIMKG